MEEIERIKAMLDEVRLLLLHLQDGRFEERDGFIQVPVDRWHIMMESFQGILDVVEISLKLAEDDE